MKRLRLRGRNQVTVQAIEKNRGGEDFFPPRSLYPVMVRLRSDLSCRLAPGSLAVGAEGGYAEPVTRPAGKAADGELRFGGGPGVNPGRCGRRVGAAFNDI